MRVFVYGWYGHGNAGDESYKLSFRQVWPQHEFTFGETPEGAYDVKVIGGGDVVRQSALQKIKPDIAVSVTITAQSLCPEIYDLQHIYVRDEQSAAVLQEFGYTKYTYLPDISIILQGNRVKTNKIGIISNAHLLPTPGFKYQDRLFFDKFVQDMAALSDISGPVTFIPFSTAAPWDDRVTNGLINSQCQNWKKNDVIYEPCSVKATIDKICECDLVITTRFHGLIFALGNHVPVITLSFHDKFSGFCKSIDQPYLDYYNYTYKQLLQAVETATVNDIMYPHYDKKVHLLRS